MSTHGKTPLMPTRIIPIVFLLFFSINASAQMITGVWSGRINKQKVEVKFVQKGDNFTGTAYYYGSGNNYRRYSIKGYYDPLTNSAVWWDDQLLEEKGNGISSRGKIAMLSRADFNCPDGRTLKLDGSVTKKDDENDPEGEVHLEKTNDTKFPDEWDYVIENYTVGAHDPYIIDSIEQIAFTPTDLEIPDEPEIVITSTVSNQKVETNITAPTPVNPVVIASKPQSIQQKFVARKKVFTTEIPISGDSIELRFYDNAEIDGDSISLFLNDVLIFSHIKLTGSPYTIKLPVSALNDNNELVMVAENLGRIPPNTSAMVAIVNGSRFEARLSSTENTSALIRMKKAK